MRASASPRKGTAAATATTARAPARRTAPRGAAAVPRSTRVDDAYAAIRRRILDNVYPPGHRALPLFLGVLVERERRVGGDGDPPPGLHLALELPGGPSGVPQRDQIPLGAAARSDGAKDLGVPGNRDVPGHPQRAVDRVLGGV